MGLGVLVAFKLSSWAAMSLAAVKATHVPGCVSKSIGNRPMDGIIPLYLTSVGPHLKD